MAAERVGIQPLGLPQGGAGALPVACSQLRDGSVGQRLGRLLGTHEQRQLHAAAAAAIWILVA